MGYMLGIYASTGLELPGISLMMATTRGILISTRSGVPSGGISF